MVWREGGDHSFAVAGDKRGADAEGAALAATVAEFLTTHGEDPANAPS